MRFRMEYLKLILKKEGILSIIESIVFAILGLILVYKPEGTLKIIACILGTIFILFGVFKIINYFYTKGKYDFYNYDLVFGVLALIIGIVTMIYSSTIGTIFRIIIGIWIIYSALIRISLSVKLKTQNLNIWLSSLVLACIMLICGLYITLNSGAIIITIGIMMIVSSVIDIIEDIMFMKSVKNNL